VDLVVEVFHRSPCHRAPANKQRYPATLIDAETELSLFKRK
jgi:hypothetical protein